MDTPGRVARRRRSVEPPSAPVGNRLATTVGEVPVCGEARERKLQRKGANVSRWLPLPAGERGSPKSRKVVTVGIKQYKPTSPGRRFQTVSDFSEITTSKPEKSLLAPKPKKAGRNCYGRITTRHQGGGNKQRYRIIDFKRNKDGVPAKVATIEYDPNRSARIALLHYVDGEKRYIIHPKGLKVGDIVVSGPEADIKPGNALPLANIPVGTLIHNVELQPGKGAAIARSAGTSIQLMGKEGNYAILRMPSSEMRRVLITCRATIGEVGNAEHSNIKIGKAGRKRWMGVRPTVRGTVMNPVDHPHGGGEGKNKSAGRHPVTPWGVPTKGHRTRNPKKASSRLIIRRRKK